ncbi:hypothetical protein BAUCODRAFT_32526 [Baudoinia panamericana UAMH 10762]|uniref:AB hydrolase-1 domain-containing protein n=1 Tax=Baudoinia panamericana (strain UAMH 10762) TaxID=717646 RepID=M2N3E2_BAUPA|nr:uncharacterized protein BAUCODRAFT_32526 [Baudoinia panamericana UAMH 10762]EMC98478.1 hypothetical protein BAUCODRAFT_32526 [Baudoinia panamericana UAMH 10762]
MGSALNLSLTTIDSDVIQHVTKTSSGCTVRSYSHDTGSGPVLCMVHGYPQSSYMYILSFSQPARAERSRWRHVVPMLKDKFSMFAPELPGYGISSLPAKSDKRTVGGILMEALQSVFGKERSIIWCSHDRGARVGHRLAVDNKPEHKIIAAIFMDIVPTAEQWRVFANPAAAVAYYHWPFLAGPTAPQLIEAMGGRVYCQDNLNRSKGANEAGAARLRENDAVDHYCTLFDKAETISGSCADYAAGAFEDVVEQEKDQQAGRKVTVPTMVIYSKKNLGRMHDVEGVWKKWVDGDLRGEAIPNGYGHYLPEECPEEVAKLVLDFAGNYAKQ